MMKTIASNKLFIYFFALHSLFIIYHSSLFAQKASPCPLSQNKKAISYYDKAVSAKKSSKDYETIKEWCEKAIEEDTTFADPYLLLGNAAWFKKDFKTMKEAYKSLIETCPDASPEPHYRLGSYLYDTKKYDEAVKYLKGFLDFGSTAKEKQVKDAEQMIARAKLMANPVPFYPKPVKGVSTSDPEYLAIISADNEFCYFTRRFEMQTKSSLTPVSVEKFIQATRQPDGEFDNGKPMDWPFNLRNTNNEGGPTISLDNQHLYFTVNNNGNFDIYYTDWKTDGWDPIKNLGDNVNDSLQWDAQPSISSDNKTLYFASYRDSVYGTSDIFVTKRKNGKWSDPVKLSSKINTNGNEKSPFIHPDDKTFYFSSDSLPGMGGFDIYMCKRDSNGNWGTPANLGYPINTEADEVGFFVSTDGKKGYFASNNLNSTGGYDIYSFELPEKVRPEKTLMLSGQFRDENNEIPYAAKIELKNISTDQVMDVEYDSNTGKYAKAVLFDSDYILTIKQKDYAFNSKYFAVDDSINSKPVRLDLDIKKIELGNAYTLNDILFDSDSYELKEMSKRVIEDFSEFLKENPKVNVAIHGHTDNEGGEQNNLTLSSNRARAVYNYVIKQGINAARLSYKGFGQTRPVASNTDEIGKAKNRRTEFVIISK
ncbi:MAG: OmpA family protein [Bacteroidia bacterium]